ncbi:MAG: lytic murein transglycosylase [Rickettsiales bacterium]|jgi:membrane-bound lytic murein transglycosylase B|nr:lytic murein transglycosylase [Rickettsiales bacterium]
MLFNKFLLFVFIVINVARAEQVHSKEDFALWLESFKKYALTQKITQNTLDIAMQDVKFNEKIIALDRKQPEHKKTFWDYYKDAIKKSRVEGGKLQIKKYSKILKKVSDKYDVSMYVIVAFWDLETSFGRNMGQVEIIPALANMAYDNRRRTFFTQELINALKIVQKKQVDIKKFKGSWAGAFGNFQFMPSTFLAYAVDGDGDGKIDLYNNTTDAIYSAGNFLSKMGWHGKYRWGRPITFDRNRQEIWDIVQSKEWYDMNIFIDMGIKSYGGKIMKKSKIKIPARLLAPMGKDGPVFMVYENFKAILKWNNSASYALNVGLLSDAYLYNEVLKME